MNERAKELINYAVNAGSAERVPMVAFVDPCEHHSQMAQDDVQMAVGYVPDFVQAALDTPDEPFIDTVCAEYTETTGSSTVPFDLTLTDAGVLEDQNDDDEEERDPPLYPLVAIATQRGCVFVYHYGIVALVDALGNQHITRMD